MATLPSSPPSTAASWKLTVAGASSLTPPSLALRFASSCFPVAPSNGCPSATHSCPRNRLLPFPIEGSTTSLAGLQDGIKIFAAVFFWISLFFWYSAWNGKNNNGGRPNKGDPFRR